MASRTLVATTKDPASMITILGQNLKIVSVIIEAVTASRDLVSLALVCRSYLPLAAKILWSKPKFANNMKLGQFLAVLSSPGHTLAYRTFIQALDFNDYPEASDYALKLLGGCQNLTHLQIPQCQRFLASTLQSTLPQFVSLVVVDFEGLRSITDEAITGLVRSSQGLQGANLSGCVYLTDRALLFLGNYCSNLREVFLNNIPRITAFGLRYLLVKCPRIQSLSISQCKFVDDEILRLIWATLPTLRKLLVAGCQLITDQGFVSTGTVFIRAQPIIIDPIVGGIADIGPSATKHPAIPNPAALNLKHLDLTDCEGVTDLSIRIITSNSPKLHVLILKGCFLLTDISIRDISRLGKNLHTLGLAKLPAITDGAIEGLVKHCRRLKSIDLSECKKLTDRSVHALSTLSKIEGLSFNSIQGITDEGIRALGDRRRTTLRRLHLSYCTSITTKSIDYLLAKQPQVDFISLSGIPSFLDDPELETLSKPAGKGYSQKTFRVYSNSDSTAQLQHLLSQRSSDDAPSAAGSLRLVVPEPPKSEKASWKTAGPVPPPRATVQSKLELDTGWRTSGPKIAQPPPGLAPAQSVLAPPRQNQNQNQNQNQHPPLPRVDTTGPIKNSSPIYSNSTKPPSSSGSEHLVILTTAGMGAAAAAATTSPPVLLPESEREGPSSDPVQVSGSMSSFEDLEDGSDYDILRDSDLEYDHEEVGFEEESEAEENGLGEFKPAVHEEDEDVEDDDGFELLLDCERVDVADLA